MNHVLVALALSACLVAGACSAPAAHTEPAQSSASPTQSTAAPAQATAVDPRFDTDYVLVILKTGPRSKEYDAQERTRIQAGHMANIQRLAGEEKLFVAGPFGEPRHDPTWRGIFVFDVRTVEEAQALAATDPAALAGLFTLEAIPFRGASWLPELLALEQVTQLRAKQEGRDLKMEDQIRGYAMVTTSAAAATERVLAPLFASHQVVLAGRLGGERAGGGLYVLDAKDVEAAKVAMGASVSELGSAAIDAWWATPNLVALERTRPAR